MAIKVVIGTKKGKCLQKELSDDETKIFQGLKIGDRVSGGDIGFAGYDFEISGGSDNCGFPMRKDIDGAARKKILAVQGIGMKKKANGIRQRKTVCGNTVHDRTSQVNLRILKEGAKPLIEEAPPAEPAAETSE